MSTFLLFLVQIAIIAGFIAFAKPKPNTIPYSCHNVTWVFSITILVTLFVFRFPQFFFEGSWSLNLMSVPDASTNLQQTLETIVSKRDKNTLNGGIAAGERPISQEEIDTSTKEEELRKLKAIRVASYEWWVACVVNFRGLIFGFWRFTRKSSSLPPIKWVSLTEGRYGFREVFFPEKWFWLVELPRNFPVGFPIPRITLPGYTPPSMFVWIPKIRLCTPPYNVLSALITGGIWLSASHVAGLYGSDVIDLRYPSDIPGHCFSVEEKAVTNSVTVAEVKLETKKDDATFLLICTVVVWGICAWFGL